MSNVEQWSKLSGSKICSFTTKNKERRTKVVCTIGVKTQTVEMLEQLMKAGMNIVRMNFSHGDHEVKFLFLTIVSFKNNSKHKKSC